MVRLTSMTMSMYFSENMMTAWLQGTETLEFAYMLRNVYLMNKNRAVGRN